MSEELVAICVLASAAGVAAAQAAGPVRLGWPANASELVGRVSALARRLPSRRARAVGAVVVGLVLAGGGLAAYAAMPAAPKRIISQVVQSAGREVRAAFLGDPVAPAASPIETAAPPPAPAPLATRAELDAQRLKMALAVKMWDGVTVKPGLTLDETRRYYILTQEINDAMGAAASDIRARAVLAGLPSVSIFVDPEDQLSLLGPDALEYALLENKQEDERQRQAAEAYEKYGPVVFHVANLGPNVAAEKAPYPGAGWVTVRTPDKGGYDIVMTPDPEPLLGLSLGVAANPPPLALRVDTQVSVAGREGLVDGGPVTVPTWAELAQAGAH